MKEKMNNYMNLKSETGITMIALVITIVVLIIVLSITLNMGNNELKEATDRRLMSELGMVSHALLERKIKADLTNEDYPGTQIQDFSEIRPIINAINANRTSGNRIVLKSERASDYYKLETEEQFKQLGIKNSEYRYIVNYETGEVINMDVSVTPYGEPVYSYSSTDITK